MTALAAQGKDYVAIHPAPPGTATPLRRARSTFMCAGIASFRARALFDRYIEGLPESLRAVMSSLVPGLWLPAETVTAHFASADTLGLTPEDAFAIGVESGERTQNGLVQTLTRLAAGAGATPWTALHQYGRIWDRSFDGGGVTVRRVGPKDALVTLSHLPFARFEYFRCAFAGSNHAGLGLFTRTMQIREHVAHRTPTGFALRVSWV